MTLNCQYSIIVHEYKAHFLLCIAEGGSGREVVLQLYRVNSVMIRYSHEMK